MIRINAGNYDVYRRWFERSLDLIFPPELRALADPMAELAKFEAVSKAEGIKAVTVSVTDMVAMSRDLPEPLVGAIDRAFEADGLPSLTMLRRLLSKDLTRILKAGAIASDDEYYMLKALDPVRDESTIVAIEKLLGDYESRSASGRDEEQAAR